MTLASRSAGGERAVWEVGFSGKILMDGRRSSVSARLLLLSICSAVGKALFVLLVRFLT